MSGARDEERDDARAVRTTATPAGRPRPYSVSGVFPARDRLLALLPVLEGVDRRVLVDVPRAMHAAARGGEDPRDDPRSAADDADAPAALAARIREGTGGLLDPRDVVGYWDVVSRYRLAVEGEDHRLRLTRRGRAALAEPDGRVLAHVAGREGLTWITAAVDGGATTLAALLPGWRAVLDGNPRFRAAASHPRSLGQRVAALVRAGCLAATGAHAERLADETGFRGREPEPAYRGLGGGLAVTGAGRALIAR